MIDSLAVSRWSSSLTLTELGRHAESLVDSELAMAQADRLIALDPGNDNAHRLRMILRSDRALVLGRLGRFAEAMNELTLNGDAHLVAITRAGETLLIVCTNARIYHAALKWLNVREDSANDPQHSPAP